MTREELYELVWSKPISKICKEYPVADVRLKIICNELNIPLPENGHWQKINYGKKIIRPPLPNINSPDPQKTILLLNEITEPKTALSPLAALTKSIEEDPSLNLVVPERLTNPDKLILRAKEALEKDRQSTYYRPHKLLTCYDGNLDIRVTPVNVPRALRFMDTFIKALRARGHDIQIENGTRAVILEQEIKIIFREKTKKGILTDNGWTRNEFLPTGVLAFQIDRYDKREWTDGRLPLESHLANIIAKLELIGKYWYDFHVRSERQEMIRNEQEKVAREIRERKEKEESDFKKLLAQSSRWHEINQLRHYIDHLEKEATNNNCLSEEDATYFSWAREKADKYDPALAKKEK